MLRDTLAEALKALQADAKALGKLAGGAELPDRLGAEALVAVDKMRDKLGKLLARAEDTAGDLFNGEDGPEAR